MKSLITVLIIILNSVMLIGQKQNNIWYFGWGAGLDFNTSTVVALTGSSIRAWEGSSSICDSNGDILFYSDGITVWNRNHVMMPNGDSLGGGASSTQSALIIKKPNSNSIYYIFTVDHILISNMEFRFSIVDMSLDNGNGDVFVKNSLIIGPVSEKLAGVKHYNGTDFWIMVRGINNNNFYAYLLSDSGLSLSPVSTSIGTIISTATNIQEAEGYMKFSPDGTKLAYATYFNGYVDLFDFDSSTGIVSNLKHLPLPSFGYGLEFSLSGQFLYATTYLPNRIYQWDITSNSALIINNSRQLIGNSTRPLEALQLGPDAKIYVAQYLSDSLGVINSPEDAGLSCNYTNNAIFLGDTCTLGLPNIISSYYLASHTGLENISVDVDISVYPNPFSTLVNFQSMNEELTAISLTNYLGQEILIQISTQSKEIDLKYLSKGMYVCKFYNNQDVIKISKVIKQ